MAVLTFEEAMKARLKHRVERLSKFVEADMPMTVVALEALMVLDAARGTDPDAYYTALRNREMERLWRATGFCPHCGGVLPNPRDTRYSDLCTKCADELELVGRDCGPENS